MYLNVFDFLIIIVITKTSIDFLYLEYGICEDVDVKDICIK